MDILIDDDEYNFLYFSDKISPIQTEKFDFKEYENRKYEYIYSLNISYRELIRQLLFHYIHIVQRVYPRKELIDHIPLILRNLSISLNISTIVELIDEVEDLFNFNKINGTKRYTEMVINPKRYECENAYFHTKSISVLEYTDVTNKMIICRSTKMKPRTLKQLAAEIYINSDQWIYTSILDLIQYNFKDMVFSDNINDSFAFYDILLMKFIFQYFLRTNDTNFPQFRLICKCTYGLKNKNHINYRSYKDLFARSKDDDDDDDDECLLC